MRNAECGMGNRKELGIDKNGAFDKLRRGKVGMRNFSISDFGLTEKEKVNHGMARRITEKE